MTPREYCSAHEDNTKAMAELSRTTAVLTERIGHLCEAFEKHLQFNAQFMPQMQDAFKKVDVIDYKLDAINQHIEVLEQRIVQIESLREEYAVMDERVKVMWKWIVALGTTAASSAGAMFYIGGQ